MTIRKLTYSTLAAVVLYAVASAASAVPIITFDDIGLPGGVITYDGNGGPAVGEDIVFNSVIATDVPLNGGVPLVCVGCSLDFVTGPNLSEGSAGTGGSDIWLWGSAGSSFTLTGGVETQGGATIVANGSTLLTGAFTNTPQASSDFTDSLTFTGSGFDDKNDALLQYFGIDPGSPFRFSSTNIALASVTFAADGGFNAGVVTDADLNNTLAVPGPGALGIFTFGLVVLGLGLLTSRRMGR